LRLAASYDVARNVGQALDGGNRPESGDEAGQCRLKR